MTRDDKLLLQDFWPYLLNRAAETTGLEFQRVYRLKYGMLRTEWRVLFHLGRYGPLTAKAICERAGVHKTKVSRAVAALEKRRFLSRERSEEDRRHEILELTPAGQKVFAELVEAATTYNEQLLSSFTAQEVETFERVLKALAGRGGA